MRLSSFAEPYRGVPVPGGGAYKGGSCQERPEGKRVIEQGLEQLSYKGGSLQDQAL